MKLALASVALALGAFMQVLGAGLQLGHRNVVRRAYATATLDFLRAPASCCSRSSGSAD
jgi:hypothetical protein